MMKNFKKKLMALCMLALLTAPVFSNVLPKGWTEPGISTCSGGPDLLPPIEIPFDDDDIEIFP